MIYIISGFALAAAGGAGLWYFLPTDGQTHPLMMLPYLELLIPVTIACALMIGISLIVAGTGNFLTAL